MEAKDGRGDNLMRIDKMNYRWVFERAWRSALVGPGVVGAHETVMPNMSSGPKSIAPVQPDTGFDNFGRRCSPVAAGNPEPEMDWISQTVVLPVWSTFSWKSGKPETSNSFPASETPLEDKLPLFQSQPRAKMT
ncbi:unnamed protein product [Strongylus vulgaris]|uniref:Uncharacterized protein n=1 Tax=Strongylus vulgaris TaxID=40348 RepID=A0A3P7JKM0_STRVU|nr:unnamed protein product [Strongylus vulgaris]